jgi:arabinogalactan oligomer / maltooligosaccharide transport system permease protein
VSLAYLLIFLFCADSFAQKEKVHLWHQMLYSQREVLALAIEGFEKENPNIDVIVTYRETEELRSSFQAAALGGSGPDLIYGPSDQIGPLATMDLITPLDEVLSQQELKDFDPLSLVHLKGNLFAIGDGVGNHLMLFYNKKLLKNPPQNTNEMIALGKDLTRDTDNDGRIDQYGLAWNFTEPFFFVPWVAGFGGDFFDSEKGPQLNTPAVVGAFQFVKDLRDLHQILPRESDYETANALFKEGKAAMLINGDWSWGDYKKAGLDFAIAPMPKVSSTGLWPSPLVGTKGYSINKNSTGEKRKNAEHLLRFLTSAKIQLLFAEKISSYPSRLSVREYPLISQDALMRESKLILEKGRAMPVVPEIRAVWDALRGPYQSLLGGTLAPKQAAEEAQLKAQEQIRSMNEVLLPAKQTIFVKILVGFGLLIGLYFSFRALRRIILGFQGKDRVAYLFLLPGLVAILAVIIFPFFYNLTISLSNFSLRTFRDWQIIGFQHYAAVFLDPQVYSILAKTLIWTFINVFFHVSIGILLALLLDQAIPARPLFRTLLIIPWAVPQYITALSWRSFFHQEYGPINIAIERFFHLSPVQWLSRPFEAFSACILTNVWLGFPFMMIVALGGLQAIPKTLYEAAKVDGANAYQRFRVITLPLLFPVMAPAAILGAVWTFNNLNVIWLVSSGGEPADKTHILVSYVYKAVFNQYRYGYGAALSVVIFLMLSLMILFTMEKSKADKGAY